jgi:hypothetical protein
MCRSTLTNIIAYQNGLTLTTGLLYHIFDKQLLSSNKNKMTKEKSFVFCLVSQSQKDYMLIEMIFFMM